MKSVIQEASSLYKAIEQGWEKAGKPKEFCVRVLQESHKNFLGMTTKNAKVAIFFGKFDEHRQQLFKQQHDGNREQAPQQRRRPQHPRPQQQPHQQRRPQQGQPQRRSPQTQSPQPQEQQNRTPQSNEQQSQGQQQQPKRHTPRKFYKPKPQK